MSTRRYRLAALSFVAVLAVAGTAFALSPASASVDTQAQTARDTLANCQLLAAHSTGTQRQRARDCVTDQLAILRLLGGPTPTPTQLPPSPTPGSTPAPTTPAPTLVPTTPAPTTVGPPPPPPPTTAPPTGWPSASNTGVPAGTTLRATTGRTIITSISGEDVAGCITIGADNVTIRNSRIRCATEPVNARGRSGVLVEDVEVDCGGNPGTGLVGNLTARRVNAHGCENGASLDGKDLIEDSYIHDLYETSNPLGHTDGIQIWSGADDIVIRHNWIENKTPNATSAIIGDDTGMDRITIDGNRLIGGGYVLRCPQGGVGNVITNNTISGGGYGPWVYCEDEAVVSGNKLS